VLAELYNRANQWPMWLHAALIDEMIKFVHGSNSHAKKAFQNLVLERRWKTLFIFESEQSAAEL
jgi:hypothetical protein